ncbi:AI-2E family transporter [Pararhodonellum marinum]|uniref:AI-2E family transporter n=1 Tax=Pararhodonellum marinum TaxID=2755358 RepID=UPI00188F6939|nr:AI-2E family transporter [Pararhodonellum marinum]
MRKSLLYILIFIVTFCVLLWYFSNITLYLIFSLVIAAILRPLTNRVNSIHVFGQHIPRWLAILFSFGAIVFIFFLISLLFIPLFRNQVEVISKLDLDYLYEQIQNPVAKIEEFLIRNSLVKDEPGYLIAMVRQNLISSFNEINIQGFINSVINTTSSVLISIISIAFITFFLLLENGLLRRNFIQLVPNKYFEIFVGTFHKVERLLSNYLIGLVLQISVIFSMAAIGLTFVRVDYALTIAIFAAVANLIPYAGPVLGATFGILVGISTGSFTTNNEIFIMVIKILSVFSVVQVTDNVILQPLIFSKSVKAHPLEIFVIIFVGAKIGGVLGMIFAIPVYTIFRVSIKEFYKGYQEYSIFKLKNI